MVLILRTLRSSSYKNTYKTCTHRVDQISQSALSYLPCVI